MSQFPFEKFCPGNPAPIGAKLNTKGWLQEAALRMLLNNLDRRVAERPEDLVVYGGRGKAARGCPAAVVAEHLGHHSAAEGPQPASTQGERPKIAVLS